MKAQLILENGKRFSGTMFGSHRRVYGEVIFTTGMVGYQEVLTDPSYTGQIVTMTFPLIGNYGINSEDFESDKVSLSALVVREKCDFPSNFRSEMTLEDFMKKHDAVGLYGIDTRALTKELTANGTMKGVIIEGEPTDDEVKALFSTFNNSDCLSKASAKEAYVINPNSEKHIALIDLGAADALIRLLSDMKHKVTIFPKTANAEEILKSNADMVYVSNGPENLSEAENIIANIKELIGKVKLTGTGFGHLLIGAALGAKIEKLKFGHHGANQPVKNTQTNDVFSTVQNHSYVLTDLPDEISKAFINVNDNTIEGIAHKTLPIRSTQFDPAQVSGKLSSSYMKFLKEVL